MAIQTVPHDPFAPLHFVLIAERRRLRRSRIAKHMGAAAFIVSVFTIILMWATDPVEAQAPECMACLTDPANDLPATKGDVYDVDVKTQNNAEAIAIQKMEDDALASMIQAVKTDTTQQVNDLAALAGVADSRVLSDMRSDIDDVDRSSKRRDAAVLVSHVPDVQVGETFALDVQIGTVGGETALGAGASMSFDAPVISSRIVFGGSASTDTGGNEQAFVGKVGLRF